MDSQAQIVRITIEQLAKLVKQLAKSSDEPDRVGWTAPNVTAFNATLGADTIFLKASQYRRALIVGVAANGPAGIAPMAMTSGPQGIILTTTNPSVILTYADLGHVLTSDWHIFGSGGVAPTITWLEISSPLPEV